MKYNERIKNMCIILGLESKCDVENKKSIKKGARVVVFDGLET